MKSGNEYVRSPDARETKQSFEIRRVQRTWQKSLLTCRVVQRARFLPSTMLFITSRRGLPTIALPKYSTRTSNGRYANLFARSRDTPEARTAFRASAIHHPDLFDSPYLGARPNYSCVLISGITCSTNISATRRATFAAPSMLK